VIIRVNDITDKVRHLSALEEIAEHPVLKEMQDLGECFFKSPLSVDVAVFREYDHIRLEGAVSTEVALNCSRCLASYNTSIKSSFTIFYSRFSGKDIQDEEVELGEHELVSAYYEGDQIDLSSEISDHVLIEFPLKPLCSFDCRGFCMDCGADLNLSPCNCADNRGNLAFSALKNFKLER
jgi:uncharacterized protein